MSQTAQGVLESAQQTDQESHQLDGLSNALAKKSSDLRTEVEKFLNDIRG